MADGKHDAQELLQAQAYIWNHIFNFINSMSLKTAIQLGIPDAIHSHGKPISLSLLIAALPIHPAKARCIPRLMRILIHSGFFAKAKLKENDEAEGYVLTKASKLLLKDNPFSVTPFLLAMLDRILTEPWHYLSTWFQNDDATAFTTAHGMGFWEYAGNEPKLNNFFNEAMASDARLVMRVLIDEYKGVFEGLKSLVDVGGGTGTMAKAIAKAFPRLDCIVFDLPHVVAGLAGSENLKYVAGDMFEGVPPADAILLKWIMHVWSDEECLKLLKLSKEAIKGNKEGKLIIIDMVLENRQVTDHQSIESQLFFDMLMMTLQTGKQRNKKEWGKLFLDAGFSDYKITPILGLRSVIEVYP
ncbi:trans-resveratrol di-O-methyltransferase [Ricinus communis]|uniref:O-methyltransferase, putative n=1 Tax=Ricinus communis TaxID=3988 RepID=B9SGP0_RICCO|nr:trans-resveratrol di-O-methyltransferase [Ricinus communis]EEF37286.1 o-methyltransferase, putative [Ricinus communis]|eukprot:XP_002525159.1 trans-resveratrol di-O-methyltransferase [Ricinus communis]